MQNVVTCYILLPHRIEMVTNLFIFLTVTTSRRSKDLLWGCLSRAFSVSGSSSISCNRSSDNSIRHWHQLGLFTFPVNRRVTARPTSRTWPVTLRTQATSITTLHCMTQTPRLLLCLYVKCSFYGISADFLVSGSFQNIQRSPLPLHYQSRSQQALHFI